MRLAPILLLLVAGTASAQSTTNYLPALTGAGTVGTTYQGIPGPWMSWRNGASSGAGGTGFPMNIDTPGRGPGPLGTIDITGRSVVPNKQAVARALARGLPLIGTALAFKDIFDAIRCQPAGEYGECDLGTPEQVLTTYWCTSNESLGIASTQVFACASALDNDPLNVPSPSNTVQCSGGGSWTVGNSRRRAVSLVAGNSVRTEVTVFPVQNNGCIGSPVSAISGVFSAGDMVAQVRPPTLRCFEVTRPDGTVFTPSRGVDGRCPTLVFTPTTPDVVEDRVGDYTSDPTLRGAAPGLVDQGIAIDTAAPPGFSGQPSVQGDRSTTRNPDGSTTVRDKDYPIEYGPGGYTWRERIIEFTVPPGTPVPPPTTVPGQAPPGTQPGPITETPANPGGGPAPEIEIETCGLPGKPKCQIDETGTPEAPQDDPKLLVEEQTKTALDCIAAPASCFPTLPSFSWSFAMPTGCAVIPIPVFSPFLTQVDVCQFQPMFHDIMSVVWVMGGLFGAISMFWRKTFSG